MKKKKVVIDIIFIVIAAVILTVLTQFDLTCKYFGFTLIPILVAYFLGQFIERKTRISSER